MENDRPSTFESLRTDRSHERPDEVLIIGAGVLCPIGSAGGGEWCACVRVGTRIHAGVRVAGRVCKSAGCISHPVPTDLVL